MTRRSLLQRSALWSGAGLRASGSGNDERSFWVLRLLNPRRLFVRPLGTARLHCGSREEQWVVEGGAVLALSEGSALHTVSGPGGAAVEFTLEVPGVLRRSYRGVLRVAGDGELLRPVVTMDCETATGSIVGAELPVAATPRAALAAQAVVSRSVLQSAVGRHRHGDIDCCDTTHCQFLRSPAVPAGVVAAVVGETDRLILRQGGHTLFARYCGACGGSTEEGTSEGFRYVTTVCQPCLAAGRRRQGHGWGLCQQGAIDLAGRGWNWHSILAKYYPNALVGTESGTV